MEIKKCPFCGGIGELTMDEKIEEMAKCICPSYERKTDCETCPTEWCYAKECATMAFCNGYRKESDTAREIYKELFEKQTEVYNKYVFKNEDYDDLETNAIINFSDSLSYEFEKYFKEKYGVDLGE